MPLVSGAAGRASARLGTWNTQWAVPSTPLGNAVSGVLKDLGCNVMVLTEVLLGLLPTTGHRLDAETDWGYQLTQPDRRKVAIWSTAPWRDPDVIGHPELPGGRFVAATTDTPLGALRVVGVCIPWAGAHVTTGRCDRSQWGDHLRYLDGLRQLLGDQPRPLVVAGDFNQRIPRDRQPQRASEALYDALHGLGVATAGETTHGPLIDHVATNPSLRASNLEIVSKHGDTGELSDHHGAVLDLEAMPA